MPSTSLPISEQIASLLAPYIGEFNAQMWVKSVTRRELGLAPEELTPQQIPTVVDGLRPYLQTLMGRSTAEDLLLQITREVR